MEQRDWPMKFPSPWHANASVCARAFIKPVPVRQSGLRRDRDVRGLQSLRTFDHIELHQCAFLQQAEAAGLIALKWTNTSSPPSVVMNPKPFASLDHLTVPV
jgi:hypothetical protein